MKLHEYQSKLIFSRYGVPIPKGRVASTAAEARTIAAELGGRCLGQRCSLVADGRQFRVRQSFDRLRVKLADHPRPDNAESVRLAHRHQTSLLHTEQRRAQLAAPKTDH